MTGSEPRKRSIFQSFLNFSLNFFSRQRLAKYAALKCNFFFSVHNSIICSSICKMYSLQYLWGHIRKCRSTSIINLVTLLPWKKTFYTPHNSCSVEQKWRKQKGSVSWACAFLRPVEKGNSSNWVHHTMVKPILHTQILSLCSNAFDNNDLV